MSVVYGPAYIWIAAPPPVHGARYFYCMHPVDVKLPKYDRLGRRTGRFYDAKRPCRHRVSQYRTYVRHWRRKHLGDLFASS